MSSRVEANGVVAAAVTLPLAAVLGAGWLAWQFGSLLIEANKAVNRQIAEKKRQIEDRARIRKITAISAYNQLNDVCTQILSQLDSEQNIESTAWFEEIKRLKSDLKEICNQQLPDDVVQIESMTSLGYLKLDSIVSKQRKIAEMILADSESGLYQGLAVADLMDDLRIIVGSMAIYETKGSNIVASNPDVLERTKLNEEFSSVVSEITEALETASSFCDTYGLSASGSAWFHSCFNGIDARIEALCRPNVSNTELKKGIHRLKDSVEQYNMLAPSIEQELKRMATLYKMYADAADALGENVLDKGTFKNSAELEERLKYLEKRAKKAQECAKIYKKLGSAAYLCYAWDQELKAMGYEVHSRKKIAEMSDSTPVHAEREAHKLPFYEWNDNDLTQLYSISSECALQVIVHDDGTISMQTIADAAGDGVAQTQKHHCAQLNVLRERLRQNWFILYDHTETNSPDEITTVSQWSMSNKKAWGGRDDSLNIEQRKKVKKAEKTQHIR